MQFDSEKPDKITRGACGCNDDKVIFENPLNWTTRSKLNRRKGTLPVTRTNQVAAPTELGTPTMRRAKIAQLKSADGRMATEAARLERKESTGRKKRKTHLTHTG